MLNYSLFLLYFVYVKLILDKLPYYFLSVKISINFSQLDNLYEKNHKTTYSLFLFSEYIVLMLVAVLRKWVENFMGTFFQIIYKLDVRKQLYREFFFKKAKTQFEQFLNRQQFI